MHAPSIFLEPETSLAPAGRRRRDRDIAFFEDARRRPCFGIERINANAARAHRFLASVAAFRLDEMLAAYAPDAVIHHPILGALCGAEIERHWTYSLARPDFALVDHAVLNVGPVRAEARWHVAFRQEPGGRRVELEGMSHFDFENGLIRRQVDHADGRRWASQVHGPFGGFLASLPGGTALLGRALRHRMGLGPDRHV